MSYSYDRTADYSYDRTAAGEAGRQEFIDAVKSRLKIEGRRVTFSAPNSMSGTVFINFINLPEGAGGGGGGAEAENNRMMFSVAGFPKGTDPTPVGKVKVEQSLSALPREYRLRAKSAPPLAIAKYLADFLNDVVKAVEPNFTHTRMPGA